MNYVSKFLNLILSPLRMLLTYLVRLTPGLKRFARLSTAARSALLTALFLATIIGISCLLFWLDTDRNASDWGPWRTQLIFASTIAVAIVFCVYLFVRWWMAPIGTLYPSIDRAWKQGIAMLASEGYRIDEVPLYLVVGDTSRDVASNLMSWAKLPPNRQCLGDAGGEPTMHWFLDDGGVFLFLSGISCVSRLHDEARSTRSDGRGGSSEGIKATRIGSLRGPRDGGARDVGARDAGGRSGPGGQTSIPGRRRGSGGLMGGGETAGYAEQGRGTEARRPRSHASTGRETAAYHSIEETQPLDEFPSRQPAEPTSTQDRRIIDVDAALYAEGESTLDYLCRLLRASRRPYVGYNGLLVTARFDLLDRHHEDLTQGIRRDLALLKSTCGVRPAATVAISGMDQVDGFDDFITLYGERGAAEDRIGKGHSEWTEPSSENLNHVAHLACDGLEEVVWETAIRADASTGSAGNKTTELRRMMRVWFRLRDGFAERLATFLSGGFATPDRRGEFSVLFAGAYFVGSGNRRAFVENLLRHRLIALQDKVAWSEIALRRDRRDQLWANLMLLGAVALVALFVTELATGNTWGWIMSQWK